MSVLVRIKHIIPKLSIGLSVLAAAQVGHALDIHGRDASQGGQGSRNGLVSLYLFDSVTNGVIPDVSGVAPALDLTIQEAAKVRHGYELFADDLEGTKQGYYLSFEQETLVRSVGPATKIVQQCQGTNELTIEAWLKNDRDDQPLRRTPLRIVSLSQRSNDTNFFLGYEYDQAAEFAASVRTGNRQLDNDGNETSNGVLRTNDSADNRILVKDQLQHVVFTRNNSGEGALYVSAAESDPRRAVPVQRASAAGGDFNGNFNGWGSDLILGLGNEISYRDTNADRIANNSMLTTESRGWRGQLYMIAIFCRAHSPEDILGDAAPGTRFQTIVPDPNMVITANHQKAVTMYKRLVGTGTPINDPVIGEMATLIAAGDTLGAATRATQVDNFFNITVRDFGKRMSTRDETANTPLNDMVATIVGVTRDNLSAKQLLTGNFTYRGDPTRAAVVNNEVRDILTSNNHYQALEEQNFNLAQVLARVDGQKLFNGSSTEPHRDPAGVVTSRAFMEAHATAGTNRRLVEYTFRQFACIPIDAWADGTGPDNWVGRDVDRFPGGDHAKFLSTCRSCHSNMDGLRGAFARYNFSNGFVKYAPVMQPVNNADDEDATNMFQDPVGVAGKMNRNADTFPGGHTTTDDNWINNSNRGLNASYFGWSGNMTGRGVRGLAEMVSNTAVFPKCMAKKVYRSVCKREPQAFDQSMLDRVANEFVQDNYNLRLLFARIAITPECIGN